VADNLLARRLAGGDFVISVEFVTPSRAEPLDAALAPALALGERMKGDSRVAAIAVTDRVKSDDDHDPVVVAERIAHASGTAPLVHLAGKDRDAHWLGSALDRMRAAGLANALLMTGDAVRQPPVDRRVRYLDSVDMLVHARASTSGFTLGAVVSPYKYREEALVNQYVKMVKKERAGADFTITQIGWDMLKLRELAAWRRRARLSRPVLAGLLLLTPARARRLRRVPLPGVIVEESFAARVARDESARDRGVGAALHRLALQIVGARRLGYAGVQLTGLHDAERVQRLVSDVEALEHDLPSERAWWDAWWADLDGATTAPRDPFYFFRELGAPNGWRVSIDALTSVAETAAPSMRERVTYRALDAIDRAAFHSGSPGAIVFAPLARAIARGSAIDRALTAIEAVVKSPLGCETCGFCRLPYTSFVCPETCPKGLANGPCGGTDGNTCEFRDRECIHNRKYRLAKTYGRFHELEDAFIPPVLASQRGTCSWTNHFRGDDPIVIRLPHSRKDSDGPQ
jgi:methylenetetrahydrofolate reductase (NADH)